MPKFRPECNNRALWNRDTPYIIGVPVPLYVSVTGPWSDTWREAYLGRGTLSLYLHFDIVSRKIRPNDSNER